MNDKRLEEIIKIIKVKSTLNNTIELLQLIQQYCRESGIDKYNVANLLNEIIEELQ